MRKKIFVLTGEPSGDKLASKVISKLKKINSSIDYLSVGGENLESLNIKSIYKLEEITFLGFTKVLLNIFKIKKKINLTAKKILEFNPDILFSVDSPDFCFRVAKIVKKNNPKIKTIHYVAPQVWIWRKGRVKKLINVIDHLLLLFSFEKKIFDNESLKSTFVGHPLLEETKYEKIELDNIIPKEKKIISIFPGSRSSEIDIFLPILVNFIKLCQLDNKKFFFVFQTSHTFKSKIKNYLNDLSLIDVDVISDEKIKKSILSKSFFSIVKSGTVSLEVCNARVPSIIIYKMNFINFLIIKFLVNIKFANIFNIISNKEVIPELLQQKCNPKKIHEVFQKFIKTPELGINQVNQCQKILNDMKLNTSSSEMVGTILNKNL